MKYVFIRHTTTDWNVAGRTQGQTDIPLNSQGRREAEQLAKLLSGLSIDFIVSSDLKRASETAKIIGNLLAIPVQLNPGLRECSFGDIEGLNKQEAIERYGLSV